MKKILSFVILTALLTSCGRKPGKDGLPGVNGVSFGVEVTDLVPGLVCSAGGVLLSTFKDLNSNGMLDLNEVVIKAKTICNGVQGNDGASGQSSTVTIETVSPGDECPTGGARISSNSSASSVVVCNGVNGQDGLNGLNGLDGQHGTDGQDGANGQDGASIIPVKFCSDDTSTFPEYGLLIGDDLFAVYWGTTPASPNNAQAFLTKLVPGAYQSTGGNNCQFTITEDHSNNGHHGEGNHGNGNGNN